MFEIDARNQLRQAIEDALRHGISAPEIARLAQQAENDRDQQMINELENGRGIFVAPVRQAGPCPCPCNRGGFCGGCGHAGCGRR